MISENLSNLLAESAQQAELKRAFIADKQKFPVNNKTNWGSYFINKKLHKLFKATPNVSPSRPFLRTLCKVCLATNLAAAHRHNLDSCPELSSKLRQHYTRLETVHDVEGQKVFIELK